MAVSTMKVGARDSHRSHQTQLSCLRVQNVSSVRTLVVTGREVWTTLQSLSEDCETCQLGWEQGGHASAFQ